MRRRLTGLLALAALTGAAPALADDCATLAANQGKQLLLVTGSTALKPLLNVMGPKLAAAPNNILVAYLGNGSCSGVNGVVAPDQNRVAAGSALSYFPESFNEGAAGTAPTCTLSAATATQLAISDVFLETCTRAARPSTLGDFTGPAQVMTFVVPPTSTQTAITADEAYFAFGFGGAQGKQAAPWTDPNFFFIRPDSSGTLRILASVIGVPNEKWFGQRKNSAGKDAGSGDVLASVSSSANGEGTIGILGMEVVDAGTNREKVKVLALKGRGQKFAYYPDATSTSHDKINVREGRYAGLGYAHLITPVDAQGVPTNANAKTFIDVVMGTKALAGVDMVKTVAQDAKLIPLCAMKVHRTAEGGDLHRFKPATACGCYFESLVGTASASCKACTADSQCSSDQSCQSGFCEAK
ncbi:hypothetical protein [Corallococcus sp. EGB]|uniref:hypothetical protein n=1 Tax=Corallococcus sp. EGB TaxID=1521117 RepID=UPI001CBFA661|nr:hypothetical protein [Corallococcus sp. EGB]